MTTELATLTHREQQQLSAAEADIRRGGSLIWGGLKSIHDRKLYRAEYDTFEDYCEKRWSMSQRHARRLIEHGKVLANIGYDQESEENTPQKSPENSKSGPMGPTSQAPSERATRVVADLAPSDQKAVYEKASNNGSKKPTAKEMKAAREKVAPKTDRKTSFDVEEIEGRKPPSFNFETHIKALEKLMKFADDVKEAHGRIKQYVEVERLYRELHSAMKSLEERVSQ